MKASRDKNRPGWTLMLIGDHGKVIELRHVKAIVFAGLLVLLLALAAAAALYVLNQRLAGTNRDLRMRLATAETQAEKVKQQADLLMARVALAEAQTKQAGTVPESGSNPVAEVAVPEGESASPGVDAAADDGKPPQASAGPPVKTPSPASGAPPTTAAPPPDAPPQKPAPKAGPPAAVEAVPRPGKSAAAAPGASPDAAGPPGPGMVRIDELKISHADGSGLLRLEFKIRNVSPTPQRVSGRVVAVLKGEEVPAENWVVMPRVKLVDGAPSGTSGYRFEINNWRTMRLRTNFSGQLEAYTQVEIFVFSPDGELMLREAHPVAAL